MPNGDRSWSTVVGHDWAVEILESGLRHDRLAHAYLLVGPPHIGKTTLARTLAQAVNCETGSSVPCQRCRSCLLISRDRHPDVWLIEPELSSSGRAETLRIERIRNLQKDLSLAPYEARFRVVVLARFHQASAGAANALLKTLEEPPTRVKLILTADQTDGLLPTIVSRCQVLTLRPLPLEKVEAALLLHWGADEEQAHRLAHISGGRLGLAVRLQKSPQLDQQRAEHLDMLEELLELDRTGRFRIADRLATNKSVSEILELWLGWWRDVMLAAADHADPPAVTNIDRSYQIRVAASRYRLNTARLAIRSIQDTLWQLDRNANTRLALEVLMLNLPA